MHRLLSAGEQTVLMAAIAAKAVAKRRAAGNGKVPFVAPELPWRKEVDESLVSRLESTLSKPWARLEI